MEQIDTVAAVNESQEMEVVALPEASMENAD